MPLFQVIVMTKNRPLPARIHCSIVYRGRPFSSNHPVPLNP